MHNLVKESTGVDFIKLGTDLDAVKEAILSALDLGPRNPDRHSIEACSSVGHVLNEVNIYKSISHLLYFFLIFFYILIVGL